MPGAGEDREEGREEMRWEQRGERMIEKKQEDGEILKMKEKIKKKRVGEEEERRDGEKQERASETYIVTLCDTHSGQQ